MQWAPFVLDRLVAPKCSELTACLAPELPEPRNYFGSFLLNNVFIFSHHPDKTRWPILYHASESTIPPGRGRGTTG
jgi:hypothetical protein